MMEEEERSLSKEKTADRDEWCEGPVLGKIIRFAVPLMLTSLLQLLFNAADLVVVGRFSGSTSVGAVGATGALTNLMVNLFIGMSVGTGVSAAHAIGAKNDEQLHRIVHTSVLLALIAGGILTVLGVSCSRLFLTWMETPEDVLPLAAVYMRIYFCGMPFNMLYNYGASILRAAGDSKSPLRYLTLAGILNVILNVIFVVLFHMDVAGVALATALTQGLSAFLILRNLSRRKDACCLRFKALHVYGPQLSKILRIGLPAGLQGCMFSISNVMIQSSVNSFGSIAVSGNAAASNIEGFVWVTMNAITQAGINFSGRNVGAGRYDRMKRISWSCEFYEALFGLVFGIGSFLLARPLLSIYITDSLEAIEYGRNRIMLIGVPYCLCGINDCMTALIRGMGYSLLPMIISVAGICGFRLFWIYCVFSRPEFHTLQYLFLSYPISWMLTFLVSFICYRVIIKKKLRGMNRML